MIRPAILALAAAAFGLAAAAPAQAQCTTIGDVRGFAVIDRENLVLHAGARRHYLVTVDRTCPGLQFTHILGTRFSGAERLQRICVPGSDYILVERNQRCYIQTVEQVSSVEEAEDIVAERAAANRAEAGGE